jgi:hypothetical protein
VRYRIAALAGALLSVSAAAAAPTFRAEAEGDTLVIYSTSDKDVACYTMVAFSFKNGDERERSRYVCNGFARAQKDLRFCERSDARYIDLKIEGPVTSNCG